MHLGQVLEDTCQKQRPASDGTDFFGKIRYNSNIRQLIGHDLHWDRELATHPMFIRIPDELDKNKAHEHGREEIKGTVLIAGDTEIGTFFIAWPRQIDLVVAGDLADQFILKYLQPGMQPSDAFCRKASNLP